MQPRAVQFSFNFKRKLWHMLGLLVPAFFYFDPMVLLDSRYIHATRIVGLSLNVIMLATLIIVDLLRFKYDGMNDLFIRFAGPLLKEQEKGRMNATVPYLTATLLLFTFTQDLIAGCACTFLMLGDPAAAYIGGRFGRIRFWNSKSLEGMFGFFLVGFLAAFLFSALHTWLISLHFPNALRLAAYSLVGEVKWSFLSILFAGGVVAAVTEFFSNNRLNGFLDDNLEVPILAGVAMATAAWLLGFPVDAILFDPTQLFARA